MPVYEYNCETCGIFTGIRPISEANFGGICNTCGALSDRALATPNIYGLDAGRRKAFQTNERSAHEPYKHSVSAEQEKKSKHKSGCSCCSSKSKKSSTLHLPDGSKTFPTKRSWMISH